MLTEQEIRDRITDLEEAIDEIVSGERLVEVTTGDRHERRQEASSRRRLQALRDKLATVATGYEEGNRQ
jgi:hypothetical protein